MGHPDAYIFHPTCELAVASGIHYYQPNKRLQQFEQDLQFMPVFLSRPGDWILLSEESVIPEGFYEDLGWGERVWRDISSLKNDVESGNVLNSLGRLKPWGWSPQMHHRLEFLKPFCKSEFEAGKMGEWNPKLSSFYSRHFSRLFLQKLYEQIGHYSWVDQKIQPTICFQPEEVRRLLDSHGKLMLKAPFSSSGRGLQKLSKPNWHSYHQQWTESILRSQGSVMVEPLLDKVADFAFQFYIHEDKRIEFYGRSFFQTDSNGKYQGNFLGGWPESMNSEIYDQLPYDFMDTVFRGIKTVLIESRLPDNYSGPLGIDAMIYRDQEGQLKVQPCLEINLRYTMGFVALEIEKRLGRHKKGMMQLYYDRGVPFENFIRKKTPGKIGDFKEIKALTPFRNMSKFGLWMGLYD